jgi:hypothetical protein
VLIYGDHNDPENAKNSLSASSYVIEKWMMDHSRFIPEVVEPIWLEWSQGRRTFDRIPTLGD